MGRDVARGRLVLPDDDIAEQYTGDPRAPGRRPATSSTRSPTGPKPGRASRHNLTYWRDEPYLGIGAGAAGWVDGLRTKNTPSPRRYMTSVAAGQVERVEEERPDLPTRLGDALALGLRLREGIDLEALGRALGLDVARRSWPRPGRAAAAGYCWSGSAGRLRIAEPSILVTSELLVRIEGALSEWREGQEFEPATAGSGVRSRGRAAGAAELTEGLSWPER